MKIYLGLPSHDGRADVCTSQSIVGEYITALTKGWHITPAPLVGMSVVHSARNILVANFLASDCDELWFLDLDLGWEVGAMCNLAAKGQDLSGIAYPLKREPMEYRIRELKGQAEIWANSEGLVEVEAIPTGLMRITRHCLKTIIAQHPELEYHEDHATNKKAWKVFDHRFADGVEYGEDFSFCLLAKECGFKVWVDPEVHVEHIGRKAYVGHLGNWLRAKIPAKPVTIAVITASRQRPTKLCAVLTALHELESHRHKVVYAVRTDPKDPETLAMLNTLPFDVLVDNRPRPGSIGAAYNQLYGTINADIYIMMTDDVFPLTPKWDEVIAKAFQSWKGPGLMIWDDTNNPGQMTYPIVTRQWLAAAGQMFDERFKFWFTDTWLAEVYQLAFGRTPPTVEGLRLGGTRGKTAGMGELAKWYDIFADSRWERVVQAQRIAQAYGHTAPDHGPIVALMEEQDMKWKAMAPEYEKEFAA